MKRRRLVFAFRTCIAILAWFALILQLLILVNNTPGNGLTPWQAVARFFIFFTILSNLLVALSLSSILMIPHSAAGRFFSKPFSETAVAVYIFVVGLVYNLILRSLWKPTGLQLVADELLHVAIPVLYLIYWICFVSKVSLKWRYSFDWLLFPFFYLIYALIRGSVEGFYPYPFLDLEKLSGNRVFLNCLGLTGVFFVIGLLFIAFGKAISRQNE